MEIRELFGSPYYYYTYIASYKIAPIINKPGTAHLHYTGSHNILFPLFDFLIQFT